MTPGNFDAISGGAISGTGTLNLAGSLFGGIDINADGTNSAVVVIRDDDASGKVLISSNTVTGKVIFGPFRSESGRIYYSITGTGASGTLYEWIK